MSQSRSEIHDEYGPPVDLPDRLGLCPIHGEHFYMPLTAAVEDDEATCPECPMPLVIYARRSWSTRGTGSPE